VGTPADVTIEALAASVEPTPEWQSAPMAALALMATHRDVPVDRLYLNPGVAVDAIQVRNFGGCVRVDIRQSNGVIAQARGCDDSPDLAEGQLIDDDTWRVQAEGGPGFVEAVKRFWFTGGIDPNAAPVMDADALAQFEGGTPTSGIEE